MFRTHNKRGRNRFLEIRNLLCNKSGQLFLTQNQLKELRETKLLRIGEKIELLQVALGYKLTTEVFEEISYLYDKQRKIEVSNKSKVLAIKEFLSQLPFHFFEDSLVSVNKATSNKQQFIWFQVSVNEAVTHFLKKYKNDLTEFEEGVLYGFPHSAIRAFSGLIESSDGFINEPYGHFLAGVGSKEFLAEEKKYYQKIWEDLRNTDPLLIAQAEKYWQQLK